MPVNSERLTFSLYSTLSEEHDAIDLPQSGLWCPRVGSGCHVVNGTMIVMAAHRQRGDIRICSMDASPPNSASGRSNATS